MDGATWLDAVMALIQEQSTEGEVSRPDDDTLAVTIGPRGVVIHTIGTEAFLIPSVASGNTIASRLAERVTHLDPKRFAVEQATVGPVVDAALAHLRVNHS